MCSGHEMEKEETVGETHDITKVGVDGCLDKTGEYCDGVKGAFRKVPVGQCLFSAGPMYSPSSLSPKPTTAVGAMSCQVPAAHNPLRTRPSPAFPPHPLPSDQRVKVDSPVHPVRDI
jgi:hypothetical protein